MYKLLIFVAAASALKFTTLEVKTAIAITPDVKNIISLTTTGKKVNYTKIMQNPANPDFPLTKTGKLIRPKKLIAGSIFTFQFGANDGNNSAISHILVVKIIDDIVKCVNINYTTKKVLRLAKITPEYNYTIISGNAFKINRNGAIKVVGNLTEPAYELIVQAANEITIYIGVNNPEFCKIMECYYLSNRNCLKLYKMVEPYYRKACNIYATKLCKT
jgi:hypothetical protein